MSTLTNTLNRAAGQTVTAPQRISGAALVAARTAVALFMLFAAGMIVLTAPRLLETFSQACASLASCPPTALLAGDLPALSQFGITLQGYAIFDTAARLISSAIFLAVAAVLWPRSDNWTSLSAMILFSSLGYTLIGAALSGVGAPGDFMSVVINVVQAITYGSFLLFLLVFPTGEFKPRWTAFSLVPYGLWLLASAVWAQMPFNAFAARNAPAVIVRVLPLLAGLGLQVWRFRAYYNPEQRQQTKWVVLGAVAAILSVSVLLVGRTVLPFAKEPGLGHFLFEGIGVAVGLVAGLNLLPLSTLLSILRYRLWDIEVFLNRSLGYVAMTLLLVAVLIGSILGLHAVSLLVIGNPPDVLVVATTALIVLAVLPLYRRVQRFIDFAFFRTRVDLQTAVLEFTREVRNIVDLPELQRSLTQKITDLLYIQYGAVYLTDNEGRFKLAEGRDLPDGKSTLFRPDEAQRAQLVGGQPLTGEETFPLALPLLAQQAEGSTLVGALALGPRRSGQGYSRDDRKLLMTLAAQAGTALHVAQLAETQLRKLEEANRLKSEFLATMSHELRTPLHAIIGYADVQLTGMTGPLTEEQTEYQERILVNADHLLKLIDDVLDIAKIEAGRMDLVKKPFAVRDWLREVAEMSRSLADQKGITYEIVLEEQMPERIVGDAGRLKQVALNLISNAIKFTSQGGVRVTIGPRGKNVWALVVSDSGMGIPPHALEYIFDEFRQVDGSTSREFGGTGLGLAIVRKLALLMGGNIRVESQVGKGSVFTVLLPLVAEPAAQA